MMNRHLQTLALALFFPVGGSAQVQVVAQNAKSSVKEQPATQEKRRVTGKVLDEQGAPLPGATVLLKGSRNGTMSDAEGKFVLTVPAQKSITLVVSFVGMKSRSVELAEGTSEVSVKLKEDTNVLGEVVATGMQKVKKYQLTGSVSVVTAKDLKEQGLTNIDRALEGLVPGLNSTTLSGAPGKRTQITIRGENSLSGNTEPLWIVDGLPMTQGVPKDNSGNYAATILRDGVGNIMPEDIESISILKDASAAAIYGARAANGVIVITTKRGYRSKTQINYSGSYEVALAPRINLDMMNSSEKLRYEKSLLGDFGVAASPFLGRGSLYAKMAAGYITPRQYEAEMTRLEGVNTDWFKEIFRTSHSHQHHLNVKGGSEKLSYYTTINYTEKGGILKSNTYRNSGVLVKLDYRPQENLIVGLDLGGNARTNTSDASQVDPFKYAVFANPYERPYDEKGEYDYDLSFISGNYSPHTSSGYGYDKFNILKELEHTKNSQTALDAEVRLNIKYEPLPRLITHLNIKRSLGYNYEVREVDAGTYSSYILERLGRVARPDAIALHPDYDNGEMKEGAGRSSAWTGHAQVDYTMPFKDKHIVTVLGAMDIASRAFNSFGYTSPIYYADYRITGLPTFPDPSLQYSKVYDALKQLSYTSEGQDRTLSYIGDIRYEYDNRYILSVNARLDGADVIGNKNQFTPLWSIGGRYNLHNEKFFHFSAINELVLRGSYGFTGQIDRSAYPFAVIGIGDQLYYGNRVVDDYAFPNPTVKWARKRDVNLGAEIALFDNRISLAVDHYYNRTDDVLTELDVPLSTGRNRVKANGGVVQNTGTELSLNVRWMDRKDLRFSTRFNIAKNSNKILRSLHDYDSFEKLIDDGRVVMGGVFNIVGEETNAVYGWKTAGINPETGNPRYYLTQKGKEKYAEILRTLETLKPQDQEHYRKVMPSLNEVPEYVDYDYDTAGKKDPWQVPSVQYLGRLNPEWVGGFSTQLRYKNVEFSTFWTFKAGHIVPTFNDYQNAPRNLGDVPIEYYDIGYSGDIAVSATNRQRKYLAYWQNVGDQTEIRKFAPLGNSDTWSGLCTDLKYEPGDYLRLNNLAVSYRINPEKIRSYGLNTLLLSLNMRNVLTFTKYKGIDVATGNAFGYPVAKEISLRVMFGF